MSTPTSRKLVLFGASNMLSDLFDCALALGLQPSLVVTNVREKLRPRTKCAAERVAALSPAPLIVSLEDFRPDADECYLLGTTADGRDALVSELRSRFGLRFASLVHPRAYVSPMSSVGEGVFVGAGCVVAPGVVIGEHVYVNRCVTVGHDTVIEPFARLMPGCNVAGQVRVGRGVTVGMGANVLPELILEDGAFVAAGAVVTRDVARGSLVGGTPARAVARG